LSTFAAANTSEVHCTDGVTKKANQALLDMF